MNAIMNSPLIIFKHAKPLVIGEAKVSDDTVLVLTEKENCYEIKFHDHRQQVNEGNELITVFKLFSMAEETPTSYLLNGKVIRFKSEVSRR